MRVRVQILGVEALHTREVRNTHMLLANHLEMVRRIDLLQGSTAVMSFESNLAFESQHLLHHLQTTGFSRWVSLAEGAHNALGWLTTNSRKEAMALMLREVLRVGKISYHPNFFSLSMTREEAKRRIGEELRNYSVITEPSKSHFGKPRKTYTGKIGGMQDDIAIAVQLVLIAMRTFFESSKYEQFSRQPI